LEKFRVVVALEEIYSGKLVLIFCHEKKHCFLNFLDQANLKNVNIGKTQQIQQSC
jgi:hypothetical protein